MFQTGHTPNHKGKCVAEEPIRNVADIAKIKQLLNNRPRDYALFVLGINSAFRIGDLLSIQVEDILGKSAGDDLVLREEKTGKVRRVTLNVECERAIRKLRQSQFGKTSGYLFEGQRGQITTSYANRLIKEWCRTIGLKGQYGAHSLRKSWAYHQRITFGTSIELLMAALNHSSVAQTLQYVCIQKEELGSMYAHCL